jgi:peptidoglycan/xylan/chitin deacetylase (PgdA/CDA1 family)
MPNQDRRAWLEQLSEELGIQVPYEAPPEYEPLQWDEVREAAAGGMEFGAHTRTHPILSMMAGDRELSLEIAGSKRRIEEQLGRAVDHFCYPNGSSRDFTAAAVQAVRAAGFRTATTTVPGTISLSAELLRLPRIGVEPGLEERYFAECVTGLRS